MAVISISWVSGSVTVVGPPPGEAIPEVCGSIWTVAEKRGLLGSAPASIIMAATPDSSTASLRLLDCVCVPESQREYWSISSSSRAPDMEAESGLSGRGRMGRRRWNR